MHDLPGTVRGWGAVLLASTWLLVLAGCGTRPTTPPEVPAPTIVSVAADPKGELVAAEPGAPSVRAMPAGYVELEVGGVIRTPAGHAVILVSEERQVAVPIFIGGTEALSIQLRHQRRRYARPLTHDLLDAIMTKLGGELIRVQIDAIRDDTFVGAVFLRQGEEVLELDARPSDAIALAIGHRVPIYVADKVIEKAGVKREDLLPPSPDSMPGLGPQPI